MVQPLLNPAARAAKLAAQMPRLERFERRRLAEAGRAPASRLGARESRRWLAQQRV